MDEVALQPTAEVVRRVALPMLAALAAWAMAGPAGAATIWTGAPVHFSKGDYVDATDPANQDLIVPGVALTRGATRGIYNAALESSYSGASPLDTEWAWEINNPGQEISAANHTALEFNPWVQAHGGNPLATLDTPGVLHIISADVYIDVVFTEWTVGGGGGFAYTRSSMVPEPGSLALMVSALAARGTASRVRRRSGRSGAGIRDASASRPPRA